MFGSKGQAFDAFKLLIAAVVAGAILVILLGIISGITNPQQEPPQVMKQLVQSVRGGGVAKISSQVVTFKTGEIYEADGIATSAGLNIGDVVFCCGGVSQKCGGGDYDFDSTDNSQFFTCSGTEGSEISVDGTVTGKIRAYCWDENEKCTVGFKKAAA